MSYKVIWFYEHRICLISLAGDVDMQHLGALMHETWHFLQDGHAPVHVILDHTRMKSLPVSPAEAAKIFEHVPRLYTDGMFITISRNNLEKFMMSNIQKMLGTKNAAVCSSINEALHMLEQVDPTLMGIMSRSG